MTQKNAAIPLSEIAAFFSWLYNRLEVLRHGRNGRFPRYPGTLARQAMAAYALINSHLLLHRGLYRGLLTFHFRLTDVKRTYTASYDSKTARRSPGSFLRRRLICLEMVLDLPTYSSFQACPNICSYVNTLPGFSARSQSMSYSLRVRFMGEPLKNAVRCAVFMTRLPQETME